MTKTRKWHLSRALESVHALAGVVNQLTEKEVHQCLSLEAQTRRRKSILNVLIRRAMRLTKVKLKEKYYG